jgi:hypothetical protein
VRNERDETEEGEAMGQWRCRVLLQKSGGKEWEEKRRDEEKERRKIFFTRAVDR